ncbi:MAG: type III-B CRISPR module-associated Cmr3 family protein [Nitrososphaerales archaeon]
MAEAVSIIFRIIEPMMFRGAGEFDPFVRGTYSRAITLAMPSPSTVAGTLATYCVSELGKPAPISGEWFEQYISILESDIIVRGPLIKLNRELMVEDSLSEGFLNMEKIRQKCEQKWKKIAYKPNLLNQLDNYLEKEKFEPNVKVRKNIRVGVRLQMREGIIMKITKEGFLYSAEYLDYMIDKSKEIEKIFIDIIAEIRGKIVERLSSARELPVKFGGEGRIALLSFQQGYKILDEIKKQLWDGQEKHYGLLALYLATPALFKGGKEVEEYVKEWTENLNLKFKGIIGESTVLGAGFMISEKKRKPIYTSLKPGSIIFLEGDFDLQEIYQKTFGEASVLGYGTIIPVPIIPTTD